MDINIFSETRLYHFDSNASYAISGYTIFRNGSESAVLTTRPFGGTAVYTKVPLNNLFIRENNYRQLVSSYTTDNRTTIDHIYTNLPESQVTVHILETYFTDHKAICALIKT